MVVRTPDKVTDLFLEGAAVVAGALADDGVAAAWDKPSVLAGQTVGGLAGHLARGGIWVVGDYLAGAEPPPPVTFDSAAHYFATIVTVSTEAQDQAIRARGASVGAAGPAAVVAEASRRLDELRPQLAAMRPDRLLAVAGGTIMGLGDYLVTRLVEQVVHLDDLARSIEGPGWPMPAEAEALVIALAGEIGTRIHGPTAMIRALYRTGFADAVLPVFSPGRPPTR
jgi:hypothetical protein